MYSRLTYRQSESQPLSAFYFLLEGIATTTTMDAARQAGVAIMVKMATPKLDEEARLALSKKIFDVVRYLPENMTGSFELHMAMAHCRLEKKARKQREARIASLLDPFFINLTQPDEKQNLAKLKALAVMVPDAVMDVSLRTFAIKLQLHWMTATPLLANDGGLRVLQDLVIKLGWNDSPKLKESLLACYLGLAPIDREPCIELILNASKSGRASLVPRIFEAVKTAEPDCLLADMGDSIRNALQTGMALTDPTEGDLDEVVEMEGEHFKARLLARCMQVVEATLAVVDQDVVLDQVTQQQNRLCREAVLSHQRLVDLTDQLMKSRRAKAPPAPHAENTEPTDLDPVYAWSMDRLLEWIEGPITKKKGQPLKLLDTKKAAASENRSRQTSSATSSTEKAPSTASPAFSEEDVKATVRTGLCSAAVFLLEEINDLLRLGQGMHMDNQQLQPCRDIQGPLQRVIHDGASNPDEAQSVLQSAQETVDSMRRGARIAQGQRLTRQRFTAALERLLRQEPLVLGKRHGGVVAARLPAADWGWAVQAFHERWLPTFTRLQTSNDGANTSRLPADCALALYVTGSSLSKHAFDISVHVWRRRKGCTSIAGTSPNHLAPMNKTDWYDTLIPCAVLHVDAFD
jgi:hypothetical protein